jgi:hypothetical protein
MPGAPCGKKAVKKIKRNVKEKGVKQKAEHL